MQSQHDQLSTFGIGQELDESAWRGIARQLLAAGLLHADPQRYGGLTLTEAARPVLKGETTLMLRRPAPQRKSSKAARLKAQRTQGAMATQHTASQADDPFFQTLRAWRARLAREQNLPAYVILHDKTLHEIAALRPTSLEALAEISGIGEAKVQRYGAQILATLKEA